MMDCSPFHVVHEVLPILFLVLILLLFLHHLVSDSSASDRMWES